MPLPENVLLMLKPHVVREIMAGRSGQERINRSFRAPQKSRIGRGVVATVAQEDDFMKRVRTNGGSQATYEQKESSSSVRSLTIRGMHDNSACPSQSRANRSVCACH